MSPRVWISASLVFLAALAVLAWFTVDATPTRKFSGSAELRADRPRPQGDVLRGAVPEPSSLNPFTTLDAVAKRYVLPLTHDALLDRDPQSGLPRPAAALSVEASSDRRTLTVVLREGLRFSDGSPVTRADLDFTLQVAKHPRTEPRSDMSLRMRHVESATAESDRRMVIHFPDAVSEVARERFGMAFRIAQRAHFVSAVEALDPNASLGDGKTLSDRFVELLSDLRSAGPGTGPYRIANSAAEQQAARRLDLEQNPFSWRRDAQPQAWNLAGVRHEWLTEDVARFAALQQGRIDWFAPSGSPSATELLATHPDLAADFELHRFDPLHVGHYYVLWNCADDLLSDARVRRALDALFDRKALLAAVFDGNGSVARGFFKPGMPEYPSEADAKPRFDVSSARHLVREVMADRSMTERPRVEIVFPPVSTHRRILEFAQPAFEAAGIELVARQLQPIELSERVRSSSFQGVVLVQQHTLPIDPHARFHSSGNLMRYANPAMDSVLERARLATNASERTALYAQFNRILRDDAPVSLLIHPKVELLIHRRFQNATPGTLGLSIESMWVARDAQQVARGPSAAGTVR